MSRKLLNAAEMGGKGGARIVEKYGNEYMSEIAKRSKTGKKQDPDYFKKLSQMGVAARRAKEKSRNRLPVDKVADLLTGK